MDKLPAENVQDYPRPPALQPVIQRIQVFLGASLIVDTDRALRVLETHHAPTYYIPRREFRAQLVAVPGQSFCEWKGVARYFDIVSGSETASRAAWGYDNPTARFARLTDHLAIYAGKMDRCTVGGVSVEPQPGDFYGGWVTPNLSGIVKGAHGTLNW